MSVVKLKKIVLQMTLHLLARKCVGIRLTSKTGYPLGSIATELAPQTQQVRHQPTMMNSEHTVDRVS